MAVTRESSNAEVVKAFRRVHPDKGGDKAEFQTLSATNVRWQELRAKKSCPGRSREPLKVRPRAGRASDLVLPVAKRECPEAKKDFRVNSSVVTQFFWKGGMNAKYQTCVWGRREGHVFSGRGAGREIRTDKMSTSKPLASVW